MLTDEHQRGSTNINKPINLSILSTYIKEHNYAMVRKYINRQNMCYGVLIRMPTGHLYVPVDYSVYTDGDITFDVLDRREQVLKHSTLLEFVTTWNKFVAAKYALGDSLYSYGMAHIDAYARKTDNGEILGAYIQDMLFYITSYTSDELLQVPTRTLNYDPLEINSLIIKRAAATEDRRSKLIGEALYNNYLYQLLLIEFANYLDMERNTTIREQIVELIKTTNFKKDTGLFRNKLREIVGDYPGDYMELQQQLITFYQQNFDKKYLFGEFNNTVYSFDKLTLNELRSLPHGEVVAQLEKICGRFTVRRDFDSSEVKFPDIYTPCTDMRNAPAYCENNKLIVNKDISELCKILAHDILDPLKSQYLLTGIWQDTTVDFLKFTRRPVEIISIFLLNG
jgi:hypothetical protein